MTTHIRAVSVLNYLGFRKTARKLEAIRKEATLYSLQTNWPITIGLLRWCVDPLMREEIKRGLANADIYSKEDHNRPFDKNGGTPHMKVVKKLLERSPLQSSSLKLLDAGCNHGYLVDHLENPVQRYIGLDLIGETIKTAANEAKERFSKIGCSDYTFLQGDIRYPHVYRDIPKDNNLIVCTGLLGHFRPIHIQNLLDNFYSILSDDESSRVIIGCPIIPDDFEEHLFIANYDEYGNLLKVPRRIDKGIRFVAEGNNTGFQYRRYEVEDFLSLVNSHGKFELVDREPQKLKRNDGIIYLCLKKKT